MKLDINRKQSKVNQEYIDKIEKDSCTKTVKLVGGLKGIYNTLSDWGKIIDPHTMTLVAEISTPLTFNEKHQQTYLPRFKQDYFTQAGYKLAE